MQISNQTIEVLKNFAMINPSIAFQTGNVLQTVATNKTIMAKAELADSFPSAGAIYDLSRFLGVVSLFETPDYEFTQSQVTIKERSKAVNYTFADPSMIVTPPQDKTLSIEEPDVDINVSGDKISAVLKAAAILQLKEVAISCDGSQVYIEGLDTNQSDSYKEIIQDWTPESTFKFIFKTESFKMLPGDYNIKRPKGSYFLNYYRRLQGGQLFTDFKIGKKGRLKTDASFAISRGKFARNVFMGQEGNQGPYRLTGASGEQFIIIINKQKIIENGIQD